MWHSSHFVKEGRIKESIRNQPAFAISQKRAGFFLVWVPYCRRPLWWGRRKYGEDLQNKEILSHLLVTAPLLKGHAASPRFFGKPQNDKGGKVLKSSVGTYVKNPSVSSKLISLRGNFTSEIAKLAP
jgi:hypothetical protein